MISVEKAYEAYPLTSDNRYNYEINAKRVGFRQGYDKCVEDIKLAVTKLRENYDNEPDGRIGMPLDKRMYALGKCNACCDVLKLLEDFIN